MRNLAFAFSFLMGYVGRDAYLLTNAADCLRLNLVAAVFGAFAVICLLLWDTDIKVVRG